MANNGTYVLKHNEKPHFVTDNGISVRQDPHIIPISSNNYPLIGNLLHSGTARSLFFEKMVKYPPTFGIIPYSNSDNTVGGVINECSWFWRRIRANRCTIYTIDHCRFRFRILMAI